MVQRPRVLVRGLQCVLGAVLRKGGGVLSARERDRRVGGATLSQVRQGHGGSILCGVQCSEQQHRQQSSFFGAVARD